MGCGSLLHDVGKLKIPLEILTKPNKLTKEERAIMNEHSRAGFQMVQEVGFEDARKIIVAHHEFQNNGYPRLQGDRRNEPRENDSRRQDHPEIQRLTEIVSVADLYDALSSIQAYKDAKPTDEVIAIMRKEFKGNQTYVDRIAERCLRGKFFSRK